MITIITGSPCSGKSTKANELKDDKTLVVDLDAIYTAIGATTLYTKPESLTEAAHGVRKYLIQRIKNGEEKNAVIISTRLKDEELEEYKNIEGQEIKVVSLEVDKEEALKRATEDNRPQETFDAIEWYFSETTKAGKMKTKKFNASIKSVDEQEHTITAYASTFHREPDSYGDIVAKGAFTETLKEWEESNGVLPLLFGHRMDDPLFNIGSVTSAEEDETGLLITATFDMENERGAYTYKLAKEGRITKLSFAYDVLDEQPVMLENGVKANELRKLKIHEVSLVPVPANSHAEVLDVKSEQEEDEKPADVTHVCVTLEDETIHKLAEYMQSTANEVVKPEVESDKGEDDDVLGLLIDIETN